MVEGDTVPFPAVFKGDCIGTHEVGSDGRSHQFFGEIDRLFGVPVRRVGEGPDAKIHIVYLARVVFLAPATKAQRAACRRMSVSSSYLLQPRVAAGRQIIPVAAITSRVAFVPLPSPASLYRVVKLPFAL